MSDQTHLQPAMKQPCLSTGAGEKEKVPSTKVTKAGARGRGRGTSRRNQRFDAVLNQKWAIWQLAYHPAERRKRPDGKSSFVHAYQLTLVSPHHNAPGHIL